MKKAHLKFTLLIFLLLAAVTTGLILMHFDLLNPKLLKDSAASSPILTGVAFMGMITLMHFLFIPLIPTSALAGYLYGANGGFLLAFSSLLFSAMTGFLAARYLGRPFLESVLRKENRIYRLSQKISTEHGFLSVLTFRLVPILNFLSVNALFGISKVTVSAFILGTSVAILPGTFFMSRAGNLLGDWHNPALYLYLGLYVVFVIVSLLISQRLKKRRHPATPKN